MFVQIGDFKTFRDGVAAGHAMGLKLDTRADGF